jgi:hypothetical protein
VAELKVPQLMHKPICQTLIFSCCDHLSYLLFNSFITFGNNWWKTAGCGSAMNAMKVKNIFVVFLISSVHFISFELLFEIVVKIVEKFWWSIARWQKDAFFSFDVELCGDQDNDKP